MSLPTRQIGGHKVCIDILCCSVLGSLRAPSTQAALNNPNVSEEAKEHSRQAIDDLESQPETQQAREGYGEPKDEVRVNAGFKATLKSEFAYIPLMSAPSDPDMHVSDPNVSEEAKQHARDVLEERSAL